MIESGVDIAAFGAVAQALRAQGATTAFRPR
jgi:hypothetical protein